MMSSNDVWGLVLSYVYAFGLLIIVEQVANRLNWPQFVSRKIIHIGAGMWTWAIVLLFDHWYWGVVPFATFIVLNYIFYRQRTFSAMDGEKESPGTVFFAFSITLLFLLGWRNQPDDQLHLILPAIMAMTWGDAMASLLGKYFGKHRFQLRGLERSLEGSVAMFIFSTLAVWGTLLFLQRFEISSAFLQVKPLSLLGKSLIVSFILTGVEAISPFGTDNLFVPLIGASLLFFLL
ncbi:diacylglycerol/polyprenol kinase family protein [Calditrichota bacterium GD2]